MLLTNDILRPLFQPQVQQEFRTAGDSHLQIPGCQPDAGPGGCGALYLLFRRDPRYWKRCARPRHPAQRSFCSPIMRIRPAQPWQMWCCGAARRKARWIPAASHQGGGAFFWARCSCSVYADDPEHTSEAQGPHQRGGGHQVDLNSKNRRHPTLVGAACLFVIRAL